MPLNFAGNKPAVARCSHLSVFAGNTMSGTAEEDLFTCLEAVEIMHVDWSSYWPAEPSIIALSGAIGAVALGSSDRQVIGSLSSDFWRLLCGTQVHLSVHK